LPIDAYRDNKELSHILKDAAFLIDTGEPGAKEAIEYIFKAFFQLYILLIYKNLFCEKS
jgi:hypothetical protein